jgi:hypothetical protein
MAQQSFNDTASVNGKVAGGGGKETVSAANSSGNNAPVKEMSGTEELGGSYVCREAAMPSGANSSSNKSPSQKFTDSSV